MSARLLVLCLLVGVTGCGGPSDSHPLATKVIGAAGGRLALADGTSIDIPAGALTTDETITISTATTTTADAVGPAYTFGPEGLQFALAATVTLPYTPPGHATVIVTAPANGATFTPLTTSEVDATHESAPTIHFSTFVVASGALDAGGDLAENDLALHDAGHTDASLHDAAAPDASAHNDASVDGSTHADASTHSDAFLLDASTHSDAFLLDASTHSDAASPSDAFTGFDLSTSSDAATPGDAAVGCVPSSSAPVPAAGQYATFTTTNSLNGVPTVTQVTDPSTQVTQWDDRLNTAVYDASAFIDPATCRSDSLSFHWTIEAGGEPITDVGITGYEKPALSFALNSAFTGTYVIALFVKSTASGLYTSYVMTSKVTVSSLTLAEFGTCQSQPSACTDPNALPTTEPN